MLNHSAALSKYQKIPVHRSFMSDFPKQEKYLACVLKPLQAAKQTAWGKGTGEMQKFCTLELRSVLFLKPNSSQCRSICWAQPEVQHGSWKGHICSINVCSCFTKGLLVKICIFFFFNSSSSKAQLFILHSFYKRDEYRSKSGCFSQDLIFLTSNLKDQSKTFIKSVQHCHNDLLK